MYWGQTLGWRKVFPCHFFSANSAHLCVIAGWVHFRCLARSFFLFSLPPLPFLATLLGFVFLFSQNSRLDIVHTCLHPAVIPIPFVDEFLNFLTVEESTQLPVSCYSKLHHTLSQFQSVWSQPACPNLSDGNWGKAECSRLKYSWAECGAPGWGQCVLGSHSGISELHLVWVIVSTTTTGGRRTP